MLAEGEPLSQEYLAQLRTKDQSAKEIMSAPVVTVTEDPVSPEKSWYCASPIVGLAELVLVVWVKKDLPPLAVVLAK